MVALDGNNRILVHQGCSGSGPAALPPRHPGVGGCRAATGVACALPDLGFALGPRLNAVGRLVTCPSGSPVCSVDDINLARQFASEWTASTRAQGDRAGGCSRRRSPLWVQIRFRDGEVPSGIVLHRNEWHRGVVGLVASKVKEKYYRPVIAFAEAARPSSRAPGAPSRGAPARCAGTARYPPPRPMGKFGSHAMAARLTLPKANIEAFGRAFEAVIGELVTPELLTGVLLTDGELLPDELTPSSWRAYSRLRPWGQAFPEPLFDGEFVPVQQRLVGRSTSR